MAKYESSSLRNIAIVGHGGTGKTSLCEALLYVSGKTDRLGRVDDGSSVMDFEPEEQKRHISINTAVNFIDWGKDKVNIVDTPGDSNFAMDTLNGLRVVDAALVVIDAVGGVEFQTEKVWEYADRYSLPRIVYVNKMDRERADFFRALESVKKAFGRKVTPLYLPIGQEEAFKGLVDLLAMKALIFEDSKGNYRVEDVPADLQKETVRLRDALVEDVAEGEEHLMERYIENGSLEPEELKEGLRKSVASGDMILVICGSALKCIGIKPLMDAIVGFLPSPLDRGPAKGKSRVPIPWKSGTPSLPRLFRPSSSRP